MVPTCHNADDEVFGGTGPVSSEPAGLQAVEDVEVDEVGAAEAADDWKPASVRSQTAARKEERIRQASESA